MHRWFWWGRSVRRWDYSIEMDNKEIGFVIEKWIILAQDKILGRFEHGNKPHGFVKYCEVAGYLMNSYLLKHHAFVLIR
jgi:hypothetical protein